MSNETKEIRILSIDGGGIRGVIPAAFLSAIEERLSSKNISEYFDIICGTSTGGIIALSVSAGIKMKSVIELYKNKGKDIFKKGFIRKVKNIIFHNSLYKSDILYKELESLFGKLQIKDLKTNILVPGSVINTRATKIFKTPHSVVHPKQEEFSIDKEYLLKDVAMATSSAPFFFSPHKIEKYYYWDGGLWANNPTICGLIEARRLKKDVKVKILSLGTGDYEPNVLNGKILCLKTLLNPVFLITYLLDIQSSAVNNQMPMLLKDNDMYRRINPTLSLNISLTDYQKIEDLETIAQEIRDKNIAEVMKDFFN